MHVDPASTDAYNTIIVGHKAWGYLPKDLYEFDNEWSCDVSCSPGLNELNSAAFWMHHMLPQMRLIPVEKMTLGFILPRQPVGSEWSSQCRALNPSMLGNWPFFALCPFQSVMSDLSNR